MGNIRMSTKEVNRIHILDRVKNKTMKQKRAADILGISVRQVRRLVSIYRRDGASGLTHKLRGIPSNNKADSAVLDTAVKTINDRYADFTVTLAHEKLSENHGFPYSRETLRAAMISVGLWKPTRQRVPIIHQIRERRICEGELVQVDGSPHAWFEERGPDCSLLVYIDDATGKLVWLEFAESESTNTYFLATKHYLQSNGKPIALYSDKHGVFRVNTTKNQSASPDDSNGLTQFGRAMGELGIEIIFANSPQAKGRVERVNQTLQDRLVKELRLRGICDMETGNRFLPTFMEAFNRRFAVVPKNPVNMHRALRDTDNLEEMLVQKHTRILSKQLTISYGSQIYQILTKSPTYAMRHAPVTVREDGTGAITILYKKQILEYTIVQKQPKSEIVDSKHVNLAVDRAKERTGTKPPISHPWNRPYLYW